MLAAQHGDVAAQSEVGWCLLEGHGVARDAVQAVHFLAKAAAQGDVKALINLARCYSKGLGGLPVDFNKACEMYGAAAKTGHPMAQYALAVNYYKGRGVAQDVERAVDLYLKAAAQGNAAAQHNIASLYLHGEGVERDLQEAERWATEAHGRGLSAAAALLRQIRSARDPEEGLTCAELYLRGVRLMQGGQYEEAAKTFTRAAEAGFAPAQYALGQCYWNGQGVGASREQTEAWMRRAAEAGYADAQWGLARCYMYAVGVTESLDSCLEWAEKAAAQGNQQAQQALPYLQVQRGHDIDIPAGTGILAGLMTSIEMMIGMPPS